jgi:hypothetical protein
MAQIKQVYDELREMDSVLGDLHALTLDERRDIITLNVPGLDERRIKIDKMVIQAKELNNRIVAHIDLAFSSLGLTGEKTLTGLLSAVPKPDRDMYADLQKSVRAAAAAFENDLAVNQALLKDSLAFTTYSLQMFTGMLKAGNNATYGKQGRFVTSIDQPRIICKEI